MKNKHDGQKQVGQSLILVAVAMVALVIFVAITVDMSNAYHNRRVAQNAADSAALAGAEELGRQMGEKSPNDAAIKADMNDFAERNGIEDTGGSLADAENANVEGEYLNVNHATVGTIGSGSVPKKAVGVRATTHITAPTFFGGIVGFQGYPLQASAAVVYDAACTGGWCMLPIAIHDTGYLTVTQSELGCFNMWDGAGAGNFGWVNWSLNGPDGQEDLYSCQNESLRDWDFTGELPAELPSDCSADCLDINMDPNYCMRVDPAHIQYHDPVGGTSGVKNGDFIRDWLKYYIKEREPVQVLVYDQTLGNKKKGPEDGCANPNNTGGLRYRVEGFACFVMTGFRLSHGKGATQCDILSDGATLACQECTRETDPVTKEVTITCPSSSGTFDCDPSAAVDFPDPEDCTTAYGDPCDYETGDVNRISGRFISCFGGEGGDCKAIGNLLAPRLTE
jgi:hypothetical protein